MNVCFEEMNLEHIHDGRFSGTKRGLENMRFHLETDAQIKILTIQGRSAFHQHSRFQ